MSDKQIINVPPKELPIVPLSREEIHNASEERLALIMKEFSSGFDFIKDYPKSITVFGSSRTKEDDPYYIKARSLGARVWKEIGYSVITGGGPGIMEAANRGAFESGGVSVGLTIMLESSQATNPYLTKHLDFHYFFSRKVMMSFCAEAYVFFPGGYGTLDEFFEIVTLIQTHKIEKIPVILVGSEFWNDMLYLMRKKLVDHCVIDEEDLKLFVVCDDEDQIIDIIKNALLNNNISFSNNQK